MGGRVKPGHDEIKTASLAVRNLDSDIVPRLRLRAAENGKSAEAEHRELLHQALTATDRPDTDAEPGRRMEVAAQLDEFRNGTLDPGRPSSAELLKTSRTERTERLLPERG